MLFIILKNLIAVACVYAAYKVSKNFFNDNQKLLRIIVAFILTIVFFGITNGILNLITPSVNVEKQLQKEKIFVTLKQKYPKEYQSIVEEVKLESKINKLNESEVVLSADQLLAPLALKLVIDASDNSRYKFTKSYSQTISLLKNKGGTLCYDMMHNQDDITHAEMNIVDEVFTESGMQEAVLTIINDNKIGKAVASQRDMDKMEKKIFKQLMRKHGEDITLLINPKNAVSVEDKQTDCQIVIDLYGLMNDPNSKVKMAVLRRNMQSMSPSMTSLNTKNSSTKIAAPVLTPEPEMAAPAF